MLCNHWLGHAVHLLVDARRQRLGSAPASKQPWNPSPMPMRWAACLGRPGRAAKGDNMVICACTAVAASFCVSCGGPAVCLLPTWHPTHHHRIHHACTGSMREGTSGVAAGFPTVLGSSPRPKLPVHSARLSCLPSWDSSWQASGSCPAAKWGAIRRTDPRVAFGSACSDSAPISAACTP